METGEEYIDQDDETYTDSRVEDEEEEEDIEVEDSETSSEEEDDDDEEEDDDDENADPGEYFSILELPDELVSFLLHDLLLYKRFYFSERYYASLCF